MPRRAASTPTLFAGGSGGQAAGNGVVLPAIKRMRRRWRKPSNDPVVEIVVLGGRRLLLSYSDYAATRAMRAGTMPVDGAEAEFRRLHKLGLVKAKFEQRGDWPVAVIQLTALGEAVLAQGFPGQ